MLKKLTVFTTHRTGEGIRVSYKYSEIDSSGNVIRANIAKDVIAVDPSIISALETVEAFINERLASEA